jgi:hypothetical protein
MNLGREERRSFGLPMLRNKNDETADSSPEALAGRTLSKYSRVPLFF